MSTELKGPVTAILDHPQEGGSYNTLFGNNRKLWSEYPKYTDISVKLQGR